MSDRFAASSPVFAERGVHLDLKGLPPTFDRLMQLLDVIAAAKFNVLLFEWEDAFPWTIDERFRSETAYSPDQVRRFMEHAAGRGLEVIPLVQCLGHMETPLGLPEYQHMREVPHRSDVLNPLAEGAMPLVRDMIDDVLALCPNVRRFHLGGDEAWTFGSHPDTRAFIEQHGKAALYLHHIQPMLDHLNGRRIRPILWHDMMIEWDRAALGKLGEQADLMVWGYQGHPDRVDEHRHFHRKHIEHLHAAGVPLWCAGAFKGADGGDSDLPNFDKRRDNALAWAEVHRQVGFVGVVTTGWSRYNTAGLQCEPIDGSLDTLIDSGHIFHDGTPMPGDRTGCQAMLADLGECDRFTACRSALQTLADQRQAAWRSVQELHQLLIMMQEDPRRRSGAGDRSCLQRLKKLVEALDATAGQLRQAFAGLIERVWIDLYLAERIEPVREQLAMLNQKLNVLRV